MFRSAFTLVAFVGYASAQLNTTAGCVKPLTELIASPDAANCLGTPYLIGIGGAIASEDSLVTPISAWLEKLCNAPSCSNATLIAIAQNFSSGCLSNFNMAEIAIEKYYPGIRQILCLEDGSTNCVTQTLDNLQTSYGSFNWSSFSALFASIGSSHFNISSNITCTDCNRAIYNQLIQTIPSLAGRLDSVVAECGPSFIDGMPPFDIVESASNSTTTPSSSSAAFGGVSVSFHSVFTACLSGLVVISTMFTLLA